MRIWSLHPAHLDRMGLLACWRETLLAQAVLAERTRGYRNHPQLERFREQGEPLLAIGGYLLVVAEEAQGRGYRFDVSRIDRPGDRPASRAGREQEGTPAAGLADSSEPLGSSQLPRIPVTQGQLEFEWQHLGRKLRERSPDDADRWLRSVPSAHPLFRVVPGGVEPWERRVGDEGPARRSSGAQARREERA